MKLTSLNKLTSIVPVAALALFAGFTVSSPTTAASPSASAATASHSVVGSWDATIEFGGATSRAMYTFHVDRTLSEADNPGFDPNFNGDALSPGVGSWESANASGAGAFAKYQKFAYGVNGQLNLVYTSSMQIRNMQADSLSGTITIDIALPDGTVVSSIPNLPFTAVKIGAI